MFLIDEFDDAGRFDHREYGQWFADIEKGSLSITFPYEGRLHTVEGSVGGPDFDSIVWTFKALNGVEYSYRCTRHKQ